MRTMKSFVCGLAVALALVAFTETACAQYEATRFQLETWVNLATKTYAVFGWWLITFTMTCITVCSMWTQWRDFV